jgi:hypothetical protein
LGRVLLVCIVLLLLLLLLCLQRPGKYMQLH